MKRTIFPVFLALVLLAAVVSPAAAHRGQNRLVGEITGLDAAAGTIAVQPRYGDPATVQTDSDTEFYRKVCHGGLEAITFADLLVGDQIKAVGSWGDDGDFNASQVIALTCTPPRNDDHISGVISAIGSGDGSNLIGTLTVQSRDGDVQVQVFADTQLYRRIHHGNLEEITFDDLAVGDHVNVQGAWNGALFDASQVIVMSSGGSGSPPPHEQHVTGDITALDSGAGTIEIQSRHGGDSVLIQTFADTEFYRKSSGGGMEEITFDDLEIGDQIKAFGSWNDAVFEASRVIVTSHHQEPPSGLDLPPAMPPAPKFPIARPHISLPHR